MKIIGRSAGRSVVAAAAYRAGERLRNERDGLTHDYTRKSGVVHIEIMLPENAPAEFADRSTLWNAVEKSENRKDSQLAREVEIALPVEFSRDEQIDILHKYIAENFTSQGMCADFAIHDKSDGNPHAHILLTMREVSRDGFGKKNRDWNATERLESWREKWTEVCNERLPTENHIDHRTLEAQKIDREPTIHVGAAAYAMEKRGIVSERGRQNRGILARNEAQKPENVAEHLKELRGRYVALNHENAEQRAEIEIEYQTQKVLLELRVGKARARELLYQPEKSPREQIDILRAERVLNNISDERFSEILENVRPLQAALLSAQHELARIAERLRGREH